MFQETHIETPLKRLDVIEKMGSRNISQELFLR
jgi:hypothetical protein